MEELEEQLKGAVEKQSNGRWRPAEEQLSAARVFASRGEPPSAAAARFNDKQNVGIGRMPIIFMDGHVTAELRPKNKMLMNFSWTALQLLIKCLQMLFKWSPTALPTFVQVAPTSRDNQ